ncbi:MAG: hypothetical protein K2W95_21780 [Candidatus Obscuribacterales bacterium]|nr:hypothetical protein [Candidatus Obscuribacterales bacterium]
MTQPPSSLEEELERYAFSFPILDKLTDYFAEEGRLEGKKIGWHCHLTGLTAAAAKVLLKSGAKLFISECTAATTDWAAVTYMKQIGASVYQGFDSPRKVLENRPEVTSDTGFVLTTEYLKDAESGSNYVSAGCEITTSGVHRLREYADLPLPVLNINDGELKALIENYHGVGDGVIEGLFRLTWRVWAGRAVSVVGYGKVGAGVANYLRRAGATVFVVEVDPIRQLVAHYDGFALMDLHGALANTELIVTATGSRGVIGAHELPILRDGAVLMNVGHWAEEIDMAAIRQSAKSQKPVAKHLEEYVLADGDSSRKIYVIAAGGPANVVLLSGSPEPTLIHLTTELLCMNYLVGLNENGVVLKPGENAVPREVERRASILALQCLGLSGCMKAPELQPVSSLKVV